MTWLKTIKIKGPAILVDSRAMAEEEEILARAEGQGPPITDHPPLGPAAAVLEACTDACGFDLSYGPDYTSGGHS